MIANTITRSPFLLYEWTTVVTTIGTSRDNGSKTSEKRETLSKFKHLQKGIAKKKRNYYHFAIPIEAENKDNLSETLNNIKLSIYSLHELSQK